MITEYLIKKARFPLAENYGAKYTAWSKENPWPLSGTYFKSGFDSNYSGAKKFMKARGYGLNVDQLRYLRAAQLYPFLKPYHPLNSGFGILSDSDMSPYEKLKVQGTDKTLGELWEVDKMKSKPDKDLFARVGPGHFDIMRKSVDKLHSLTDGGALDMTDYGLSVPQRKALHELYSKNQNQAFPSQRAFSLHREGYAH